MRGKNKARIVALLALITFAFSVMPASADLICPSLIAGGGGKGKSAFCVGKVKVWNDECYLYVKYTTWGGWLLAETHLAVGDIPVTGSGQAVPGRFPYAMTHGPGVWTYTYCIPLSEVGEPCTTITIAAHADVYKWIWTGCEWIRCEETAWGCGCRFTENNWAMYFTYHIQSCD